MLKKILLFSILILMNDALFAGNFDKGQCTYGVDKLKNGKIDWRGNAKDWLRNAKQAGYKTGKKPKKGAIVVWGRRSGHVGVITKLSPLTYKAMNDWNVKTGKTQPYVYVTRKVAEFPNRRHPEKPLGYIYFDEGKTSSNYSNYSNYSSKYVADVTYPDGSYVARGKAFIKKWKMKNIGNVAWKRGAIRIVPINSVAKQVSRSSGYPLRVTVYPGRTTTMVAVKIRAPRHRGHYKPYYRLKGPNGFFGQKVFADFRVR